MPSSWATMCAVAGSIWSWLVDAKISRSMSASRVPGILERAAGRAGGERRCVLAGADGAAPDPADRRERAARDRQPAAPARSAPRSRRWSRGPRAAHAQAGDARGGPGRLGRVLSGRTAGTPSCSVPADDGAAGSTERQRSAHDDAGTRPMTAGRARRRHASRPRPAAARVLVDHLGDGAALPGPLADLERWRAGSSRLRSFVDANRDKIRKRSPRDDRRRAPGPVDGVPGCDPPARRPRIDLAFEAYGAVNRGPDFTATYRADARSTSR